MKKSPKSPRNWLLVLEACRRVAARAKDGQFTAAEVALEAKIKATGKSTAQRIASAWLGKFYRWGYVMRVGSKSGSTRWIGLYELTSWGEEYGKGKRSKPKKESP